MVGNMKNTFIDAYVWLYGSTKKTAERIYRTAIGCGDYRYVKEVIACFENNSKQSFYND